MLSVSVTAYRCLSTRQRSTRGSSLRLKELVDIEERIKETSLDQITKDEMYFLKRKGFSDRRLAKLLNVKEDDVRNYRHSWAFARYTS